MGLLGRGKTAHHESPVNEKERVPLEEQVLGDDTHNLVSNTVRATFRPGKMEVIRANNQSVIRRESALRSRPVHWAVLSRLLGCFSEGDSRGAVQRPAV